MPNESIIYLVSTALWTRWMAIGVFISGAVILATAIIAWVTLIGTKKRRQADNSIFLFRLWRDEKYYKSLVSLIKNFKELFPKENKVQVNPKKESKTIIALETIKDFIYKINYYLENKKITMENLKVDFSAVFGVNDKYTAQGLYDVLNKYENRYKSLSVESFMDMFRVENKSEFEKDIAILKSIDTFFMKIAKYQENDYLIGIIQKNIKRLEKR